MQAGRNFGQRGAFWLQKSRRDWLKDGDRNAKFYHEKTISRRRKSKITMLRDDSGQWVEEDSSLRNLVLNFYSTLFEEEIQNLPYLVTNIGFPSWSNQMVNEECLSNQEIKLALNDIFPLKAPGANGFPVVFFQQSWNLIGGHLFAPVKEVWQNLCMIKEVNNTYLTLIPKVDRPEFVSRFRPISF